MKIGLLGLGTVGKGVYDIIRDDFLGCAVTHVLVKHPEKHDEDAPFVSDVTAILEDDEVDVVIETMGGIDVARDYISRALRRGKHVITANKAVVFAHGDALSALAKKHHVMFRYEASVCAAMIVLDPLRTIAGYNHLNRIEGIVNGSTNFILTRMADDGMSFADAHRIAVRKGYIETGTDDDVKGYDAMRKLGILASIGFKTSVDEHAITRVPLDTLSEGFHAHVKSSGKTIRHVAAAIREDDRMQLFVVPAVVGGDHAYAQTKDTMNMLTVHGRYHETMTFTGQGAGRYPTASAIVYDLLKIAAGTSFDVDTPNRLIADDTLKKHQFLIEHSDGFTVTGPRTLPDVMHDPAVRCFAWIPDA